LSSILGCHDDDKIRNALDEDEAEIVRMLQDVLNCNSDKTAVLQLRGNDAERFLTLTHNVGIYEGSAHMSHGRLSGLSTSKVFHWIMMAKGLDTTLTGFLVKLSENCGILRSYLSIVEVDNCGQEPVGGAVFPISSKHRIAARMLRSSAFGFPDSSASVKQYIAYVNPTLVSRF